MRTKIIMLAGAIAAGAAGIWVYQSYGARHPSTDDAYVGANVVRVAPRVTGRLVGVTVTNQQNVKRGDPLFSIDPATFRFDLEQAQAQLASARREVAEAEATVNSAAAEVHQREVLLINARTRAERAHQLILKNYVSRQGLDDADAEYKSVTANLQVAQAQLDEARSKLGKPGDDNDRIVAAKAAVDHAQWALDNTRGTAACSGQVDMLNLQPGNVVRADTDMFVLICDNRYWVDANYKEVQLERIRAGQPADITVDMYPSHHFHGTVQSVSGAAGAAFSLLPPQNATGNWVKVTQRVPVRIRIDDVDPAHPLRVGTSTSVTIDTTVTGNGKVALAATR